MNVLEALEQIATFEKILVTGPQRSGTTFVSWILQRMRGYPHVVMPYNSYDRACAQLAEPCVMHGPGVSRWCHDLAIEFDPIAVVWMRRPTPEVVRSQQRIKWAAEPIEKRIYGTGRGPICEVKHEFWDRHQKALVPFPFEIHYHDLRQHPDWVEKRSWTSPFAVGQGREVKWTT